MHHLHPIHQHFPCVSSSFVSFVFGPCLSFRAGMSCFLNVCVYARARASSQSHFASRGVKTRLGAACLVPARSCCSAIFFPEAVGFVVFGRCQNTPCYCQRGLAPAHEFSVSRHSALRGSPRRSIRGDCMLDTVKKEQGLRTADERGYMKRHVKFCATTARTCFSSVAGAGVRAREVVWLCGWSWKRTRRKDKNRL